MFAALETTVWTKRKMENKKARKIWDFVLIIIYLLLAFYVSSKILSKNPGIITNINYFEFFIIVIATFRSIRLVTYSKIFLFFRDFFKNRENELSKSIHELLICPWCTGIWMALIVVAIYFLIPFGLGKVLVFILAIAGLGSLIQVFANMMSKPTMGTHPSCSG